DEAYRALRESQQQLLDTNLVLQRLIKSDGLTGLANRRYFDEYLEIEWSRALRDQSELSLLMIDVDYFKAYNDQHGHVAGDEVLRRVGESLRDSCTRASDLAARYGGEEFAVIMPGTAAGGARLQAEKIRRAVEAMGIPHDLPKTGSPISVSIGIATIRPSAEHDPLSLVIKADEGLYLAKHSGRKQVALAGENTCNADLRRLCQAAANPLRHMMRMPDRVIRSGVCANISSPSKPANTICTYPKGASNAGAAWRKAWVSSRCAAMPQPPSASIIRPCERLGSCQKNGTSTLITSVLTRPATKLLVVALSTSLRRRVRIW